MTSVFRCAVRWGWVSSPATRCFDGMICACANSTVPVRSPSVSLGHSLSQKTTSGRGGPTGERGDAGLASSGGGEGDGEGGAGGRGGEGNGGDGGETHVAPGS